MPKYYVESGELHEIVDAWTPIRAISKALQNAREKEVPLARIVTANERGFIRNRLNQTLYETDLVLETGTLLGMMAEHEL